MANPATLRPFPPGVSGNPNGRPKGSSITARIRARCAQETDDGRTIAERIADRFVAEALKGKFPFAREVLDRVDGKVTERVEHTGLGGGPVAVSLSVLSRDELDVLESIAERLALGRPGDGPDADSGGAGAAEPD